MSIRTRLSAELEVLSSEEEGSVTTMAITAKRLSKRFVILVSFLVSELMRVICRNVPVYDMINT